MKEIDKYMSPTEAAIRWGLSPETVRFRLKHHSYKDEVEQMIKDGLIKRYTKPGGKRSEWIISEGAMKKWYGEK